MPYCSRCGAELPEAAAHCPQCGAPVGGKASLEAVEARPEPTSMSTIDTVAFAFMVIACIGGAFAFLIPLLWCIPMTIYAKRKMDAHERIGAGFKVCVLLFMALIPGILLLCRDESSCR